MTGVALLCTGCGPDLCDVGRLAHIARGLLEELVMDRGRHQQLPIVWGLGAIVLLGGWLLLSWLALLLFSSLLL